MNIHYFQHAPHEGLGSIIGWAEKPGNKITATKFYEDHRLPFIDLFDMLIVMGGPMGANDEDKYSWMTAEKKMIENAIKRDKVVVGICLGSQLIADVLGAKVYPNKEKEIGWFPINITTAGKENFFRNCPDTLDVFHWHGDTYDLPAGSTLLASSEACKNQAFSYGNVLGLQFHPEATRNSVEQFLQGGKEDLEKGNYIQTGERMLAQTEDHFQFCNHILLQMLEQLTAKKLTI